MPDRHALLGPSGAHKWLNCPASARAEEQMPETSSIYSKRGQAAHLLGELKIERYYKQIGRGPYNDRKKAIYALEHNGERLIDAAAEDNTDFYLDYVKETLEHYGRDNVHLALEKETAEHYCRDNVHLALEKELDLSAYVPESFGTADCIILAPGILHVIDYKNGSGVPVSSEDNPQMQLYALGALLYYADLFQIDVVRMTIVQPALSRHPETIEMTAEALLAWAEGIKEPARKAFDGLEIYNPGDHCKFCKARPICPAYKKLTLELEGFTKTGPELLSLEDASAILKRAQLVAAYAKALEEHLLRQCLDGRDVPGYKAVEGRSLRSFADTDAALKAAQEAGIDGALLYERRPVTLAALEKIMGKKAFNEALAAYVVKPPGKPTLAPADDKRPAIDSLTSAALDFAAVTDQNDDI